VSAHSIAGSEQWFISTRGAAPKLSIIIPIRDKVNLLRKLLSSMTQYRTYHNYEILVVDNGSVMPDTLAYLARARREDPLVRVLRIDEPFNFSRLNNIAAWAANGEILVFLNNDTEITHYNWLEPMLVHVMEADVGAVGALLLFPNRTVQHVGVNVTWPRGAVHKFRHWPVRPSRNILHHIAVTFDTDVSAITAACMMIRREVFLSVGGFDESRFAVNFNDVDICIRLRKSGYRIVVTPRARLLHHESVSRRPAVEQGELDCLLECLDPKEPHDAFWNPNLLNFHDDMVLAKPWRMSRDGRLDNAGPD
jgi:GT2 family glycosyltransferase